MIHWKISALSDATELAATDLRQKLLEAAHWNLRASGWLRGQPEVRQGMVADLVVVQNLRDHLPLAGELRQDHGHAAAQESLERDHCLH